jgi:hypothetical protein
MMLVLLIWVLPSNLFSQANHISLSLALVTNRIEYSIYYTIVMTFVNLRFSGQTMCSGVEF